jgi:hypothetical protein
MLHVPAHKGSSGLLGTQPSRFYVQFERTSEGDMIMNCLDSMERKRNQGYLWFGDIGGQTEQIYLHMQLLYIRISVKIVFRYKLRYSVSVFILYCMILP